MNDEQLRADIRRRLKLAARFYPYASQRVNQVAQELIGAGLAQDQRHVVMLAQQEHEILISCGTIIGGRL